MKPADAEKIAAKYWKEDSVFLHHTGDMFGIGCSAYSLDAINKISHLKMRDDNKGYIVLIPHLDWLHENGFKIYPSVQRLLTQYWPGNLTMLLHNTKEELEHLAMNGKIAFRVPSSPQLCDFLTEIGVPIISTSINLSGMPYLTTLSEIKQKANLWFDFAILPDRGTTNKEAQPSTIMDIEGNSLKCIREGSLPYYEVRNSFAKSLILFVCTGNVCRSPIAEYLLREKIKKHDLPFSVASAGTLRDYKSGISLFSGQLLQEAGIDSSMHASQPVTEKLLSESWIVLTMEKSHKDELLSRFPDFGYKIFTLSEYADMEGNIDDPYGKELEDYQRAYAEISTRIEKIFEKIIKEGS
ncbi:MAG: Sua5/YciO/YrdC/YwlC family protein [Candidatus Cloacimonetes bacterium]|nr:Sua5/YciO/YrdC/YwlC family protein [Candidatus Cloacimonadota bacterium]